MMTKRNEATAEHVASWMVVALNADRELYQEVAVSEITSKFGERFAYQNADKPGLVDNLAKRARRESFSMVLSPQLTVAVSSAAQWSSARGLTSNVGGSTKPKSRGVQPWSAKHVSAALTKLGSSRC